MGGINPMGRNWSGVVNWDALGKFYASIAIAWTVILCAAMSWLYLNRHLSFLRIRNIPLAIAATSFLHVYLVKILFAYTTNGHFLCSVEFWIMSIYLPFGIALFQANIMQLHSISGRQRKLLEGLSLPSQTIKPEGQRRLRGLWLRWRAIPSLQKTYILIGVGMVAQLIATAAIYGTSAKLQGHWAVFGHISHAKGQAKCRKGWEWVPSTIWQLVWSWFVGPYILYQIRNVKDVHYWRLQIILSVISGLPGSPLWLAALYSPAFRHVNRFFVPPMWLAPGLMIMQGVTVFFPIYEAFKSRAELGVTLEAIKTWEEKRLRDDSTLNSGSSSKHKSYFSSRRNTSSTTQSLRSREMHTMAALEKALILNPVPLLHFAVTKDFTGENIVFLMQVRDWRAAWDHAPRDNGGITTSARARLFAVAVEIYVSSVHAKTAEFPINIESQIKANLDNMFGTAASDRRPYRDDSIPDPFKDQPVESPFQEQAIELSLPKSIRAMVERERVSQSAPTFWGSQEDILPIHEDFQFAAHPCVHVPVRRPVAISSVFDQHAFDAAERSIKYLVLTNTWQKFVQEQDAGSP